MTHQFYSIDENFHFLTMKDMKSEKRTNVAMIEHLNFKLEECKSGNEDAVIPRKELDLCRDELSDELNQKNQLNQNLQVLQNQLASEKTENENFKTQLTAEKAEIQDLRSRIR